MASEVEVVELVYHACHVLYTHGLAVYIYFYVPAPERKHSRNEAAAGAQHEYLTLAWQQGVLVVTDGCHRQHFFFQVYGIATDEMRDVKCQHVRTPYNPCRCGVGNGDGCSAVGYNESRCGPHVCARLFGQCDAVATHAGQRRSQHGVTLSQGCDDGQRLVPGRSVVARDVQHGQFCVQRCDVRALAVLAVGAVQRGSRERLPSTVHFLAHCLILIRPLCAHALRVVGEAGRGVVACIEVTHGR